MGSSLLHQWEEKTSQQANVSVLECPQIQAKGHCWPSAHIAFWGISVYGE